MSATESDIPTYEIQYQAKAKIGGEVSLFDTNTVIAVSKKLKRWDTTETKGNGNGGGNKKDNPWTQEYLGLEHDPKRPSIGITLRVSEIPESQPPDLPRAAIQELLDALNDELDVDFGSAANVGRIQ